MKLRDAIEIAITSMGKEWVVAFGYRDAELVEAIKILRNFQKELPADTIYDKPEQSTVYSLKDISDSIKAAEW